MKRIPLTQGLFALVDDADFDRVSQFKWHAQKNGRNVYASRRVRLSDGRQVGESLHNFVLGIKGVDHEDGDGLNDQRYNLRAATHQQNMHGPRRKMVGASSIYRGVCWSAQANQWKASIRLDGKNRFLGYSKDETLAARAYDKAALKLFGDFAQVNFRPSLSKYRQRPNRGAVIALALSQQL